MFEPLDTKLLKETETKRAPTPTSTSTYVIELLSHSQDLPVRPLTVEVVLHETFLKEEKEMPRLIRRDGPTGPSTLNCNGRTFVPRR